MAEETVTLTFPETSYRVLKRAAELTHRSLDDLLASTLNVALSLPPELPSDLADELGAMVWYNDQALWAASESSLSPSQRRRMSQLTEAGKERPLAASETAELEHLLDEYDRSVLRRARALAILGMRGYPIPARTDLPDGSNGGR